MFALVQYVHVCTYNMHVQPVSEEFLQVKLKKLDETLAKWEMKMNWEKKELMRMGKVRGQCCVEVGDRKLESVEVVKYSGVMISGDERME